MSSDQKYSLNYFNKYGKVELCRLIFAAAKIKYEDNFIENLSDSDLQLGYLPYLQVDSHQIPLISSISRFLAKEFNLAGKNNIEMAKSDAIAQSVMLLIDAYYRNVYNVEDMDQKKLGLKVFLKDDVENAADIVENLIKMYSKSEGFCVGDSLTYADLFVYEMATNYFPEDISFTERFPHIYKVKSKVEEEPNVSSYVKENPDREKNRISMLY